LITNNCLRADDKRDLVSNEFYLIPNAENVLPPLAINADLTLTEAINNELKCIEAITLLNAPNTICTERYGTGMNNSYCWPASSATQ